MSRPTDLERLESAHRHFSKISASIAQPITDRLHPVYASISEDGLKVTTVFEIEVDRDLCNSGGGLHGGIGCLLLDYCSSSALLFVPGRWTFSGVSHSIQSVFHASAPLGSTIRITSTLLSVGKRLSQLRIEISDGLTGKLYISGYQTKVDVVKKVMSLDPLSMVAKDEINIRDRSSQDFVIAKL